MPGDDDKPTTDDTATGESKVDSSPIQPVGQSVQQFQNAGATGSTSPQDDKGKSDQQTSSSGGDAGTSQQGNVGGSPPPPSQGNVGGNAPPPQQSTPIAYSTRSRSTAPPLQYGQYYYNQPRRIIVTRRGQHRQHQTKVRTRQTVTIPSSGGSRSVSPTPSQNQSTTSNTTTIQQQSVSTASTTTVQSSPPSVNPQPPQPSPTQWMASLPPEVQAFINNMQLKVQLLENNAQQTGSIPTPPVSTSVQGGTTSTSIVSQPPPPSTINATVVSQPATPLIATTAATAAAAAAPAIRYNQNNTVSSFLHQHAATLATPAHSLPMMSISQAPSATIATPYSMYGIPLSYSTPQQQPPAVISTAAGAPPPAPTHPITSVPLQNQFASNFFSPIPPPPQQQYSVPPPLFQQQPPTSGFGSSTAASDPTQRGLQDLATALTSVLTLQSQQQQQYVARQGKPSRLPPFSGDPLDWPYFEHRFRQSTLECGFSNSENIQRLGEAVKGDAKRLIHPLLLNPTSDPNVVMESLKERYGQPDYIVQALFKEIRTLPPVKDDLSKLMDFAGAVRSLTITLQYMGNTIYLHNPEFLKELEKKLPQFLNVQWGMAKVVLPQPSIADFSNYLSHISKAVSRVTEPSQKDGDKEKGKDKKKAKSQDVFAVSTASSSTSEKKTSNKEASSNRDKRRSTCTLCKDDHFIAICPDFRKLSPDDRIKKVMDLKLCFRCLNPNCNMRICKSKRTCQKEGCSSNHSTLLHGAKLPKKQETRNSSSDQNANAPSAPSEEEVQTNGNISELGRIGTLLRILPITIYNKEGEHRVINALIDQGSTCSLMKEDIALQLGIIGINDPLRIKWLQKDTEQLEKNSQRIKCFVGPAESKEKFKMEDIRTVRDLDIPAPVINYEQVINAYTHLKGLKIKFIKGQKPVMLIGQPHIQLIIARQIMEGNANQPIATKCKLGWALHGPTGGSSSNHVSYVFTCSHDADSDHLHQLVKEKFSLDDVGITHRPSLRSIEDVKAETLMQQVTRRVGERFETGLLWKVKPSTEDMGKGKRDLVFHFEVKSHPHYNDVNRESIGACNASGPPKVEEKTASPVLSVGCNPPPPPGHFAISIFQSRELAFRRMQGVERRISKDRKLLDFLSLQIKKYVDVGYARKLSKLEVNLPSPMEWYLPIFPVENPNKPGKLRMVFDAAAKANGKCLNDFLLTGPDLYASLPALLLNFRLRRVAVTGDITEMFHQVRIREEDQPAQRFLFRESPDVEPDVYQLQVMMFGSVCSPYCAQYVKNLNAEEFRKEFPAAADAIIKRHYMDDYLDSLNSEEEAIKIIQDVTEVHRRGGFQIGKWISNSTTVLETINPDSRVPAAKDLTLWSEIPIERALGLLWNPREDTLNFKFNVQRAGEGIASGDTIPTKRAILRLIMLIWDPLGFLNYFIIKARIILQQLWRHKLGWDDEIPQSIFEKWRKWVRKLPKLEEITIPRQYLTLGLNTDDVEDIQLHVFCDASGVAYCAVAYLRLSTAKEVATSFIISKVRVAPLKPASIPRLELQAALIASRIGNFIEKNLDVKFQSKTFWTDSITVLKWLRSEARRFQQFVSNRVGEIQENTSINDWRWVPGKENVADEGTREGKCDISNNSRWWKGPPFLNLNHNEWPEETSIDQEPEDDFLELRREFTGAVILATQLLDDLDRALPSVQKFSSYLRLKRTTARVLVAVKRFPAFLQQRKEGRKQVISGSHLPLEKAEKLLIRRAQLEDYPDEMTNLLKGQPIPKSSSIYQLLPYLEDDGTMRMKTRLVTAKEEGLRAPFILHKSNQLTKLIIANYHQQMLQQGAETVKNELRQKFWIPYITSAVRGVIRSCLFCRRKKIDSTAPIMGNIPDFRIEQPSRAFTTVGMDYFGPYLISVRRSQVKVYGVVFTCLSTRAVHLEAANDLTSDVCILALRRLINRRGAPKVIWSDNGTNLRGADAELKESVRRLQQSDLVEKASALEIQWNFTPPGAPHFGGTWERMVRSVKTALKAVLKSKTLKYDEFVTFLTEAEAVINSRPITSVSSEKDAPEALTPFHFLIGTSSRQQPFGVFDDHDLLLPKRWRKVQRLVDHFWARCGREYIHTLQKRDKWVQQQPNIRVGEVVLVLDESLKIRGDFPAGIVIGVIPGKDNVVRVVRVKTSKGIYTRPVVKVGRLEFDLDLEGGSYDEEGNFQFREGE